MQEYMVTNPTGKTIVSLTRSPDHVTLGLLTVMLKGGADSFSTHQCVLLDEGALRVLATAANAVASVIKRDAERR